MKLHDRWKIKVDRELYNHYIIESRRYDEDPSVNIDANYTITRYSIDEAKFLVERFLWAINKAEDLRDG